MRADRNRAIIEETQGYYEQLSQAIPAATLFLGGKLPPGARLPDLPEIPKILEELDRVERFGFPNPGTWADQPVDYLEDIEAARLGRDSYKYEKETRVQIGKVVDDVFDSAPNPGAVNNPWTKS